MHIEHARLLRDEQNLRLAVLIGAAAAILCAVIWGAFVFSSGFSFGFMAIGVGAAVGLVVQASGKGIDSVFGALAALLTLASIVLGGMMADAIQWSKYADVPLWEAFFSRPVADRFYDYLGQLQIADLVFYIVGVGTATKLAFRRLTPEERKSVWTANLYQENDRPY